MIIRAAGSFGCRHRYVVSPSDDGRQWLFVCDACGLRTEQLPLTRCVATGEVVAFPPLAGATPRDAHVSDGSSKPALTQSA
jgi:hypothetical protein